MTRYSVIKIAHAHVRAGVGQAAGIAWLPAWLFAIISLYVSQINLAGSVFVTRNVTRIGRNRTSFFWLFEKREWSTIIEKNHEPIIMRVHMG